MMNIFNYHIDKDAGTLHFVLGAQPGTTKTSLKILNT
jgi:hypothetical protein